MADLLLPRDFYRSDSCYRTFENCGLMNFICCGFLNKAGVINDTVEQDYPFYAVVYVLRGSGHYLDQHGESYPVQPGSVFQRIPGRKHSLIIDKDSDWSECFVGFANAQASDKEVGNAILATDSWPWQTGVLGRNITPSIVRLLDVIDLDRPVVNIKVRIELATLFKEMLDKLKHASKPELPRLILPMLNLIRSLSSASETDKPRSEESVLLEEVTSLIAAAPSSRTTLPKLLRRIPLSYSRIRALFRQKMNVSLEAYRIQHRIEEGCRMLSSQGMAPTQVAMELGYKDYFAFSRQFKQIMGISPRQFRRSLTGVSQVTAHPPITISHVPRHPPGLRRR